MHQASYSLQGYMYYFTLDCMSFTVFCVKLLVEEKVG